MLRLVLPFALLGAVIAAVAYPLMRRRIGPNGWYGLRVEATFADATVWYDANQRSGRDLFLLGIAEIALACTAPFLRPPFFVAMNTIFMVAGGVTVATIGVLRANRMLRERRAAR